MPSRSAQPDFSTSIIFAALCFCFNPEEKSLTVAQLISRGCAPSEELCRYYLAKLIKSGKIDARLSRKYQPRLYMGIPKRELDILRPSIPISMQNQAIVRSVQQARESVLKSAEQLAEKNEMVLEVLAGECIEYSLFYAVINNLKINNPDPFNPRLQLLLMEISLSQVFMLIWRTLKECDREDIKSRTIDFSELMESTYEFYLAYTRSNFKIPHYNRPKSLKTSKVAGILLADLTAEKNKRK